MSDLYSFTYNYGNGDSYSGYGYSNPGTYFSGEYIGFADGYRNETGFDGYYYISSVSRGASSPAGLTYVSDYYDIESGNYASYVSGYTGYSGLGSEYGYAYNSTSSNSDSYFGQGYYEADLGNPDEYYTYTYTYNNGDFYTGYGYADVSDGYYPGYYSYTYNETGNSGYYYINSTFEYSFDYGYQDLTYVSDYYDAESGNYASYVSGYTGYSGLGSEYGYAYNSTSSNSDSYFGQGYYEADLGNPDEYYTYTYTYNNGDFYTGYGYADVSDGYYPGYYSYTYNETGNSGYYYINSTVEYSFDYGYQDLTYVSNYYDSGSRDYSYTSIGEIYGYVGYSGLGSESGYIYGYYDPNFGQGYYEADAFPF